MWTGDTSSVRTAHLWNVKAEPVVSTWELWSVANMLVTAHGDLAEAHAEAKLAEACRRQHEGDEIIWRGIITQLGRVRAERSRGM
jgi:hypothetical protein